MTERPAPPAWVEVDLDALAHNAAVLRRATPADARVGILVKANGYGHGAEMAARAALAGGADQVIVATLDEGLALRRAGIDAPILVVYPVLADGVAAAVEAGLQLSIGGAGGVRDTLAAWSRDRARLAGRALRLHVEVDTGMGRGGIAPEELVDVADALDGAAGVERTGVWSHLADGSDPKRSAEQARRLDAAVAALVATGRPMPRRHLVATEGLFAQTAPAYEMVRIGLAFYGELGVDVHPSPAQAVHAAALRPAMTVKARAVRLEPVAAGATVGYGGEWRAERPSRIATLPIGYADGWPRASWPVASALVRGRRVPLVGRVSMDSVCADVTGVDASPDDEFVLLGSQGDERISAADLARQRHTIPNEVFCAFGPRLPRLYRQGGRLVAASHRDETVERDPS